MLFNKDEYSKIKKLHDSVKDSDALAKLAYEFGQIANYFDRANSPRSRNFLAQEDDVKYNEFLRKGIQVKAQLQREIEGMTKGMKAGQEIGYFRSYDNKTLGLLIDAISRLSWTSGEMRDNTGKKLAKELEDLYNKYKNLVVNGKRSFDSKAKDSKVKDETYVATFWRENPQFKNGGYETTRTIEAETMAEAKKKARQMVKGVLYGSMELKNIVKSTKDSKVKDNMFDDAIWDLSVAVKQILAKNYDKAKDLINGVIHLLQANRK